MENNEKEFKKISATIMRSYHDCMHDYLTSQETEKLTDADVILMIMNLTIGIGVNIYYSLKQLEDKIGMSERRAQDHFHYLEHLDFIIINRPNHYTNGESNEYRLNYELLLETANFYTRARKAADKTSDKYKYENQAAVISSDKA